MMSIFDCLLNFCVDYEWSEVGTQHRAQMLEFRRFDCELMLITCASLGIRSGYDDVADMAKRGHNQYSNLVNRSSPSCACAMITGIFLHRGSTGDAEASTSHEAHDLSTLLSTIHGALMA
jgi:hypothetical protein